MRQPRAECKFGHHVGHPIGEAAALKAWPHLRRQRAQRSWRPTCLPRLKSRVEHRADPVPEAFWGGQTSRVIVAVSFHSSGRSE
jgi:hypothetical protein